MNPNDFIFSKYETEHKDYWFDVKSGSESEKYLTKKYMEQCMVCISKVVYSKGGGLLGVEKFFPFIEKFFPFNRYVSLVEDEELRGILTSLIDKNQYE